MLMYIYVYMRNIYVYMICRRFSSTLFFKQDVEEILFISSMPEYMYVYTYFMLQIYILCYFWNNML